MFSPHGYEGTQAVRFLRKRGLVVFVHQSMQLAAEAALEYARPYLLDEVLRDHPTLHMVIANMGHPWPLETIAMLAKHRHLYADMSGLIEQPWQAYNVLVLAAQFDVLDKLLFGSGFPMMTPDAAIENMYRINEVTRNSAMPVLPREQIKAIIERDAMTCLGLGHLMKDS